MDPASINIFEKINQICKEFRGECRNGSEPDIADWLQRVPKSSQANLLQNLLDIEVNFRRSRGGNPTSEEYVKRFPRFGRLIRQAFFEDTMMSMMDPLQDTPPIDSADFASPDVSFDSLVHQQAALVPSEIPAARRIGEYELLRELGRGGMGVVYEARHLQRQNHVALKTLPTGSDGQEINAERLHKFRNEFRSLSEINHPNLVGMQSLEVDGNQWFFTMDLIDGVDFLSWVRPDGQLNEKRLRQTLKQLATGIIFLHQCGIVHRDLKPSNVLVDENGQVIILDFGLIAELQQSSEQSATLSTGHFVGTPRYAAPEQLFGERTQATDWYALGTMIYEVLTGAAPFNGRSMELLKLKQNSEPPVLVGERSLPQDLAMLADGLLQREPDQRLTTTQIIESLNLDLETRSTQDSSLAEALELDSPFDEKIVLIGREEQLAQLETAKREFLSGREPMAVWITGKSGEGKSSLAEKFLQPIRRSNEMLVLSGRCYDRESVPFKAIDSIIDPLVRFLRSEQGRRYQSELPKDIAILARLFPLLNRVEVISQLKTPDISGLEPEKIRARSFFALRKLLSSISRVMPLVILIDDLQWGDADSAQVICDLLVSKPAPFLWLIGSYRIDEVDESPFLQSWNQIMPFDSLGLSQRQIRVEPLSRQQCVKVAAIRTGVDPQQIAEQAGTLFADSGGNPYFVEQLAAGFDSETGEFNHVPLDQIINSRLEKLPIEAGKLLEIVAVSGQPIEVSEACRSAGLNSTGTATVTHMRSERLVRLMGDQNELLVETYHDKIRESVLARLSPERSRELHLRIALTIEEQEAVSAEQWKESVQGSSTPGQYDFQLSPRVVDLAHHFLSASDPKAFVYQLLAAEQALLAFAFDDAMSFYQVAEKLIDSNESTTIKFRFWFAMGRVLLANNQIEQSIEAYDRAFDATKVPFDLARAKFGIGCVFYHLSQFDRAIFYFDQALSYLGKRRPQTALGNLFAFLWKSAGVLLIPARFHVPRSLEKRKAVELEFKIYVNVGEALAEKELSGAMSLFAFAAIAGLQSGKAALIGDGFGSSAASWSIVGFKRIADHLLSVAEKYDSEEKSGLFARNMERRALASYWAGELGKSCKYNRMSLPLLLRFGEEVAAIRAFHQLRHAGAHISNTSTELAAGEDVVNLATKIDNQQGICWGNYDLACALARQGQLGQAAIHMARANSLLTGERFIMTEPIRASSDSYLRLQCSDYQGARERAEAAWNLVAETWMAIDASLFCLPILIESLAGADWIRQDRFKDHHLLKKMLRRALFLYPTIPNHQPHLLRVGGRAAMVMGDKRKAIVKFEKAIRLCKKKGMKYQRAKSLLDLAAVKEESREENRAEAIKLLKEMESVIPRAESWLLGDQYDEAVVAPDFDLEAWEAEHGSELGLQN